MTIIGAAHVFRESRSDRVMKTAWDRYSGNAYIYGETPDQDTGTSEPKWQIWLVYYLSGVEYKVFANDTKYNCIWDDRASYFSSILPGLVGSPDFPDDEVVISNIVDSYGDPNFFDGIGVSTDSVEVELINEVVPVSTTRYLRSLVGSTAVDGVFKVYQNTDIIMSIRTDIGKPNATLKWDPYRPIIAGDTVRVTFTAFRITGSDVEAYLSCSDL